MSHNKTGLVIALAVAALIYLGGKTTMNLINQPRGLRLNNPGLIRHAYGSNQWEGMSQEQTDTAFVRFDDPRYGFRAMARILASYRRRGITTIKGIISTWAPDNENNTAAYIAHASNYMGGNENTEISAHNMAQFFELITLHENGVQPFSREFIQQGINWA